MRRLWLLVGAVLLAVAAAVVFWPKPSGPSTSSEAVVAPVEDHAFAAVQVHNDAAEGLTLRGVVRDATGAAVPNAEVFLAASSQESLASLHCQTCGEPLLTCGAGETALSLASMLEAHKGALTAGASTKTDATGAFRFEHLVGISFTVWGRAAGLGEGVKERAAPGDPVELFLPRLRSIVGKLRDVNGQPVAGTVRATSRRLTRFVEAQAGADGRFELTGLGEGPFFVQATAPRKLPATAAQVEAGPNPLTLTLKTPRRLEVHLVSKGQPIEGVVRLGGNHLSRELATKNGLAVFDTLFPSPVLVSAVSGALSALPQEARLDAEVTELTLSLDRGGTVSVTVLDEADQPVPDPTIELFVPSGYLVSSRKAKTAETIVFGPTGVGDYQISAQANGFASTLVPVVVKAGSDTSVEVTLTRSTMISGRVMDEYGRPAPGVSVLVNPTGDSVIADAEGRFHAKVPSPGLYTLQAHHSDWGGGQVKVTAPKNDVELQLERKASVEVTVTAEGRRIEGASVTLLHAEGNFRSDRPSGADGVVVMRGLPPDTYSLVATHPEFLASERQQVKLEDNQVMKFAAELRAGAAITGQVVDQLGTPVASVSLGITPRGSEPTTTDANGQFSFRPLRPKAIYAVRITQRGFDQPDRSLATAGGDPITIHVKRQSVYRGRVLNVEGQPITHFRVDEYEVNASDGRFEVALPGSEVDRVTLVIDAPGYEPAMENRPNTPDLGDFSLKHSAQVTGLVRDESGAAVPDAVVSCDTCEQSVMTGTDGRFVLSKPALQRDFTVVAKKGRRTATKSAAADASQGLELILRNGVQLSGHAYLPDGRPAAGVELAGVNDDRAEPISVVTNEDGTYAMEVPPGMYRFVMATPGFGTVATDPPALITEVRGTQAQLDFGPVPGLASISVRVRPTAGFALWLVRGTVPAVGNPPLELLRSPYAQMVYQPRVEQITFGGLQPGQYTLIWASFHAESAGGPIIAPVTVPAQAEITLIR